MTDHTPPTDQQLDAIEARATSEHLTPGPWQLDKEGCDCGGDYPCGHGLFVTAVITSTPTWSAAERCKRLGEKPRDYDFHRSDIGDFTEADWELMAHAREDVPVLVAEVRRLRAAADRLRALALLEAAHALDGLTQEAAPDITMPEGRWRAGLDTAIRELRSQADEADPMVGSLARDGFGLDEIADMLARPAAPDTLPAWLYQRFAVIHGTPPWDRITDDDRTYWEHQARAVRRAVARGGFKTTERATVPAAGVTGEGTA